MKTLRQYLQEPGLADTFPSARLESIEGILAADFRSDTPWYLRLIIGFGAWIASIFFICAVGALLDFNDENATLIGWLGVFALGVVVLLGRLRLGLFAGQCLLAVSLAAQGMIYYGFTSSLSSPLAVMTLIGVSLALLLYGLYPNFLSRLATCYAAIVIALFWSHDGKSFDGANAFMESSGTLLVFWAILLGATCWCFLDTRRSVLLAPLGYAAVGSLVTWEAADIFRFWTLLYTGTASPSQVIVLIWSLGPVAVAVALFFVAAWSAGGRKAVRETPALFSGLALALLAMACLGLTGILLGLFFLVLGFSVQARPLLIVGLIFFPVFLANYYYNLRLDLLAKSGVLIGSGVMLLLLRSGVARWSFPAATKEAAGERSLSGLRRRRFSEVSLP